MKVKIKFYGGPRDGAVMKVNKKDLADTAEPGAPGHYEVVPGHTHENPLPVRWIRH